MVAAGVAYPIGEQYFRSLWNTGLSIGVGAVYPLKQRVFLLATLEASNMPLDKEQRAKNADFDGAIEYEEGSATAIMLTIGGKLSANRSRSGEAPYLVAGASLSRFTIGDVLERRTIESDVVSEVLPGNTKTAVGLSAGAGFDVRLSPKSLLFFEANFTYLFIDSPRVNFMPLKMGLLFR